MSLGVISGGAVKLADSLSLSQILNLYLGDYLVGLLCVVILYIVLNKFLFKSVVKTMEERKNLIKSDVDSMEAALQAAKLKEEQYVALLSDAKSESVSILDQARKEGETLKNNLKAQGRDEASGIITKAKADIEYEKAKAMDSIKEEIADLVVTGVKGVLDGAVDTKVDEELVSAFFAKGEQND